MRGAHLGGLVTVRNIVARLLVSELHRRVQVDALWENRG